MEEKQSASHETQEPQQKPAEISPVKSKSKYLVLSAIILIVLLIILLGVGIFLKSQGKLNYLIPNSQQNYGQSMQQSNYIQVMQELGCNSQQSCLQACSKPENQNKCQQLFQSKNSTSNFAGNQTSYSIPSFKGVKTISLTGAAPQGLAIDSKTGYVYTGNNGDITTKCSNGRGGAGAATALAGGQVAMNNGGLMPPAQNGSMQPPNNDNSLPPPISGSSSMPPPSNGGVLPPPNGGNQSTSLQNKPGFSSTPGGNTMSIIDPTSKEIKRVDSSGSPIWPLVDNVGRRLYLAVSSGNVDVYTLNGDKIQSIVVGGTPHDLGLDPLTGIMIVSNTTDTSGTYYSVINTLSNNVLGHYKVPAEPHGIVVDETQHIAYMTTVADGEMVVIDMKTGQIKTIFATGPKTFRGTNLIGYSPTKHQLFLAENYNGQRDIEVINTDSQSVTSKIPMPAIPWGMSVDNSHNLLYVALPEVDSVAVVDINSGSLLELIPVDCAFAVRLDTIRGLGFATNIAKNSLSIFSLAQVALDIKK